MGNLILTIKDSNMRTTAFALIAMCVASAISAPSCQATDYCMGCSMSTTNSCTSCFNWGSGTVGARSYATVSSLTNCIAALPTTLVTANCGFYNGFQSSTATTKASGNCSWCKKKYLTYTVSGSTEVCTDTATTGCTAVSNAGYPTCTKASVANCDWATDSTNCIYCKSNYAVSTTGACAAYTTDSNCRTLHTDSTCNQCWPAYYWNVTKCKLAASLMSIAFLAFAAFFN